MNSIIVSVFNYRMKIYSQKLINNLIKLQIHVFIKNNITVTLKIDLHKFFVEIKFNRYYWWLLINREIWFWFILEHETWNVYITHIPLRYGLENNLHYGWHICHIYWHILTYFVTETKFIVLHNYRWTIKIWYILIFGLKLRNS